MFKLCGSTNLQHKLRAKKFRAIETKWTYPYLIFESQELISSLLSFVLCHKQSTQKKRCCFNCSQKGKCTSKNKLSNVSSYSGQIENSR